MATVVAYWEAIRAVVAASGDGTPLQMRFVLESISEFPYGTSTGRSLRLTSWKTPGYHSLIANTGHQVSPGGVQPLSWSTRFGQLSVACVPDEAILRRARMGLFVQFSVGFWPHMTEPSEYFPVFVGRIRGLRRKGGVYIIDIVELPGTLSSRFDTGSITAHALFHDGATTTVASNYTAGDSVLYVTDFSGFRKDTAGLYLLRVTNDSGGTFYVTAGAKVTGGGPTYYFNSLTVNKFGTADANASAGNLVEEIAYMKDHPVDVVLAILTSTGTGLNGSHDQLPASWGFGIPARYIDYAASNETRLRTRPASGSSSWDVFWEEQANPLSWMESWLQPAGFFLSMRHGKVAVCSVPSVPMAFTLGDVRYQSGGDIIEVRRHEAIAGNWQGEHTSCKVISGSGSTIYAETNKLLPSLGVKTLTCSYVWTNESAWRTEISNRMGPWYCRVPELIELVTAGWLSGETAPGSIVALNTDIIKRRDKAAYQGALSDPLFVVESQPDWFGATSSLVMLGLPGTNEWYG